MIVRTKKIFVTIGSLLLINIVSTVAYAKVAQETPQSASSPYAVPSSKEAVDFVKGLIAKGQEIANRPGDHQQEFGELLRDNFVIEEIAKFVLGSKIRSMSPEQRARFQKLYEKRLVKINSEQDKVNTFKNSEPTVSETAIPQIDGSVLVKSTFKNKNKPNDEPAKVDFKVVKKNNEVKILDILFENVSKLISERNEYGSIWSQQGNNAEKFLSYLEKEVETP